MNTVHFISQHNLIHKGLLLLFFVALSSALTAQEVQTDIEVQPGNYYTIKVTKEDQQYIINIDKPNGSFDNPITVSNLNSSMLNSFIVSAYDTDNARSKLTPGQINNLKPKADLRFIELIAALNNTIQPGQRVATIILRDIIPVYYRKDKKHKRERYTKDFEIESCQIVFEDGFIKTIIAKGEIDDSTKYMSNNYGIGITTRDNVRKLSALALYNENSRNDIRYILVGDLLEYARIAGLKTNDYSPADQVITIMAGEKETVSKSPSEKLFTFNIFSDLAGINQNNPNGLIQTEFNKRINFWTSRYNFAFNSGIGYLTHVIPSFEISKFEQNNRYMPLGQEPINDTTTLYYVSPFQTYRYSVANVATEVNILDIQGAAVTFHLNGFFGWGLTLVKDSIVENDVVNYVDENINSFVGGGIAKLIFNPESKWSFKISSRSMYINNLNDNFEYYSESPDGLTSPNKWVHSFEFLITWDTGNDNKLFGRYRFNNEWGDSDNNFSQFQIGYSIYFKRPNQSR